MGLFVQMQPITNRRQLWKRVFVDFVGMQYGVGYGVVDARVETQYFASLLYEHNPHHGTVRVRAREPYRARKCKSSNRV